MANRDRRKRPGTVTSHGAARRSAPSVACTVNPLLALVRELVRSYRRAPFTTEQARVLGASLGVTSAEVDGLLSELVEDGAAEAVDGSLGVYVIAPPHLRSAG